MTPGKAFVVGALSKTMATIVRSLFSLFLQSLRPRGNSSLVR
jgi:hypothetical protein